MTIWCKYVHRPKLQIKKKNVLSIYQLSEIYKDEILVFLISDMHMQMFTSYAHIRKPK